MKARKFLMIAACFATALLASCGTREDTPSGDFLPSSSGETAGDENGRPSATPAPDTAALLSMDEATKIAQTDAKVAEGALTNLHARLGEGDGGKQYTVTFATADKTFEYLIDASDGMILEKQIDTIDGSPEGAPEGTVTAEITAAPEGTAVAEATLAPTATMSPQPTATTAPAATTAAQATKITQDAAVEIARKDAGVSENEIFNLKVKFDYEDGIQVYEIDFDTDKTEYEYDIAVSDGTIVDKKSELSDQVPIPSPTSVPQATTAPTPTASAQTTKITQDAAVEIARKDAGVSENEIFNLKVKLDYEDGIQVYEIDFDTDKTEYEYEISVSDGTIVDKKSELSDRVFVPSPTSVPQTAGITQDEALAIARKDAGVSENEIFNLKVKLDYEDGIQVYEIDFDTDKTEYEYEISVSDGTIINKKSELSDRAFVPSPTAVPQTAGITQDEALAIAAKDAGVSENEMLGLTVKLDDDDAIRLYEIEFCCGGCEYEYEIAASDGSILKWECGDCDHSNHHSDHHSTHHSGCYGSHIHGCY